jgi:signal transduction histidine kinase
MRLRLGTSMKIGTRVRAYLACILGIVLGVGVFGFVANARAVADLRSSLAHDFRLNNDIDELRLLFNRAQLVVSASAAAGMTTDLADVDKMVSEFNAFVDRLEAEAPRRFATGGLRQMMSAMAGDGRRFVEANARQQWASAADLSAKFDKSAQDLHDVLQRLNDEQEAQVAAELASAAIELRQRNVYFAAGFILCVVLGVVLTWSLQRRLVDPLAGLTAASSRVVEIGDLSVEFEQGGDDELGALSRSLGLMLTRIRENIETLRKNEAALRHEIAERHHMQKKLVLADRMASVGTLAAGVAHEINNPLSYTLANLDYVADCLGRLPADVPSVDLAELRTAAAEAIEGAQRVREIVKDMKALSRVDDGRIAAVDVERALETSVNMASRELRHKARIVTDYGTVGFARANKGHLVQVFINLLVNASQAICGSDPESNEVRISTCRDAEGRVVVEIADTGGGIPEDVLPRIFDPFFTTKPIGVGTGLGLSICHGLITGMNGQIEVASKVGVGTRFLVTLPAAELEDTLTASA